MDLDRAGVEGGIDRVVLVECLNDTNEIEVFEEHEPPCAVVVGERTEWFGPQRHLRMEHQGPRRKR